MAKKDKAVIRVVNPNNNKDYIEVTTLFEDGDNEKQVVRKLRKDFEDAWIAIETVE